MFRESKSNSGMEDNKAFLNEIDYPTFTKGTDAVQGKQLTVLDVEKVDNKCAEQICLDTEEFFYLPKRW